MNKKALLIIPIRFGYDVYHDQQSKIDQLTASQIDYHYHIVRINEGLLRECLKSNDSSLISNRLKYVDINYRLILDNLAKLVHSII